MKITTNRIPRAIVYGYELDDKEVKEFDYIAPEDLPNRQFFRYKGQTYDLNEFSVIHAMGTKGGPFAVYDWEGHFEGWDAIQSDSYFSGIAVKYMPKNEEVIVGRYCT